jgi:anti-anti-sigma regulatory factor
MSAVDSGHIHVREELDGQGDDFAELLSRFGSSGLADAEVDLSQVTRFDPARLSFLVALRRICASRGGAVTLINPSKAVRRALGHGLEPYFRIADGDLADSTPVVGREPGREHDAAHRADLAPS